MSGPCRIQIRFGFILDPDPVSVEIAEAQITVLTSNLKLPQSTHFIHASIEASNVFRTVQLSVCRFF